MNAGFKVVALLLFTVVLGGLLGLYFRLVISSVPNEVYNYVRMACRKVQCDPIKLGPVGSWQKGLLHDHFNVKAHLKTDKEIRARLGLPSTLTHPEAKCGPRYTIASTNLPHECDPAGQWYCCNEASSWCGSTDLHCKHQSSVDYRLLLDPHDSSWVESSPHCVLANIGADEGCSIAESMPYHIVFVGDSQAQKFFIAFVMWLKGDLGSGAISPSKKALAKEKGCLGEYQLVDPDCRKYTFNISSNDVCNGKLKAEYFYDFETMFGKRLEAKLTALANKERTYVVIGSGRHFDANRDSYTKHFLDPLVKKLGKQTWPKVFIETLPSVPSRSVQSKRNDFAKALAQYCDKSENTLTLFENFPLTMNLRSYDGIHFGLYHNLVKVKILLNYLSNECSSSM